MYCNQLKSVGKLYPLCWFPYYQILSLTLKSGQNKFEYHSNAPTLPLLQFFYHHVASHISSGRAPSHRSAQLNFSSQAALWQSNPYLPSDAWLRILIIPTLIRPHCCTIIPSMSMFSIPYFWNSLTSCIAYVDHCHMQSNPGLEFKERTCISWIVWTDISPGEAHSCPEHILAFAFYCLQIDTHHHHQLLVSWHIWCLVAQLRSIRFHEAWHRFLQNTEHPRHIQLDGVLLNQ